MSVSTMSDRDEWVLHVKRALECVFGNPEVAPFKPSKILQTRHSLRGNLFCPRVRAHLYWQDWVTLFACSRSSCI